VEVILGFAVLLLCVVSGVVGVVELVFAVVVADLLLGVV